MIEQKTMPRQYFDVVNIFYAAHFPTQLIEDFADSEKINFCVI